MSTINMCTTTITTTYRRSIKTMLVQALTKRKPCTKRLTHQQRLASCQCFRGRGHQPWGIPPRPVQMCLVGDDHKIHPTLWFTCTKGLDGCE